MIYLMIRNKTLPLGLVSALFIYGFYTFSNYLHYGAEGIFLNGLMRLIHGQTYISSFSETPLALSTYFPTAYLLYWPFAKILSIDNAQSLAILVRLLNLFFLLTYLHFISNQLKKFSWYKSSDTITWIIFLFFIFKEWTGVFTFKPDTHALFLSILAWFIALRQLKENKGAWLLPAALFALAALFKLNMIGLGLSAGLTLLFCKRWKAFAAFSTVGVLTLAGGLMLTHLYMGGELFFTLLQTTGSDFIGVNRFPEVVQRVLVGVIFPYSLFMCLVFLSIYKSDLWNQAQKINITLSLALTFILAFIGQFKTGADINYFFDFILILVFLSPSYISLLRETKVTVSLIHFLLFASLAYRLLLPAQIVANDWRHYDFETALNFIDEQFENPKIYSENNNASTHLADRSVLAVGFFSFFEATQSIRKRNNSFSEILRNENIDAIMVSASNCQNYKIKPWFNQELSHLSKLVYQKGKICIFANEDR